MIAFFPKKICDISNTKRVQRIVLMPLMAAESVMRSIVTSVVKSMIKKLLSDQGY